jgi:uncharacterized protein DUF5666
MSITWSVRMRLLLIPFAAAALTVGCGEGQVLQSPTGPSGTAGSGRFLTADDADGTVATAASTDEFGTLAKGGNGKGNGNGGGGSDDGESNSGPGNGHKPEAPGGGGPGRSHEDRVVGFVSATTFDSVTVNGIIVTAAPDAVIRHGNRTLTMGDIGVGDHIQARGTMTGTSLVAIEIKVENTNGEDDDNVGDDAKLRGAISELSATAGCPVVTFKIGTTTVKTSATTTFDDVACSALANGALVEVTGTVAADGSITATKVELQSGPNEVKGTVFELTGTASCGTATPALTFKVGATLATATTVKTNSTTTFTGVTCATLANGANVEVEGTTQADGSITAASVELH